MQPLWWVTKDGDLDCLELYERHYSAYRYADGRKRRLFVGPGEKLVLRTGCLMRIADATEAMAKRHTELIAQRDHYERMWKLEASQRKFAERRIAASKGQITKLKKRLAAKENGDQE